MLKNGKIKLNDNLSLVGHLKGSQITFNIDSIGSINLLDRIKTITTLLNPAQLENTLTTIKQPTLFLYNFEENISYRAGKLYQNQTEIATRESGLSLIPTSETTSGMTIWNLMQNGKVVANALFPHFNFSLAKADIYNPDYNFANTFQAGSTNQTATALFHLPSVLKDSYQ